MILTHIHRKWKFTIFIGGMVTIPSHEWFIVLPTFAYFQSHVVSNLSIQVLDPKHRLFEENVLAELGGVDVSLQAQMETTDGLIIFGF